MRARQTTAHTLNTLKVTLQKEFESLSPAARKAAELNLKRQELARYIQYAESGNPQLYRPLIEEGVIFTKRTRAEPSYAIGPRPGAEQAAGLRNLGERQTLEIRPGASPDQVFKYFEQVRDKTMQIYDRLKATRGKSLPLAQRVRTGKEQTQAL